MSLRKSILGASASDGGGPFLAVVIDPLFATSETAERLASRLDALSKGAVRGAVFVPVDPVFRKLKAVLSDLENTIVNTDARHVPLLDYVSEIFDELFWLEAEDEPDDDDELSDEELKEETDDIDDDSEILEHQVAAAKRIALNRLQQLCDLLGSSLTGDSVFEAVVERMRHEDGPGDAAAWLVAQLVSASVADLWKQSIKCWDVHSGQLSAELTHEEQVVLVTVGTAGRVVSGLTPKASQHWTGVGPLGVSEKDLDKPWLSDAIVAVLGAAEGVLDAGFLSHLHARASKGDWSIGYSADDNETESQRYTSLPNDMGPFPLDAGTLGGVFTEPDDADDNPDDDFESDFVATILDSNGLWPKNEGDGTVDFESKARLTRAARRAKRRRNRLFARWTGATPSMRGSAIVTLERPSHVREPVATGHWRAAACRVDVSRELWRQPAGYSVKNRRARGFLLPRFARLCLLEDPGGSRILFLCMDALAATRWLTEQLGAALAAPLGVDVGRIVPGATHTHCASGDMFGDLFYDAFADSLWLGFDEIGAARVLTKLGGAAIQLETHLERVAVEAGSAVLAEGLVWQRALGPFIAQKANPNQTSEAETVNLAYEFGKSHGVPHEWKRSATVECAARLAVDPRVRSLVIRRVTDRAPVFIHGTVNATATMIAPHCRLLSGDVFGAAMVSAERGLAVDGRMEAVVAIVAGAHGDANITHPGVPLKQLLRARWKASKRTSRRWRLRSLSTRREVALRLVRTCGDLVAETVLAATDAATTLNGDRIQTRYAELFIPGARVSSGGVHVPVGVSDPPTAHLYLPTRWGFGQATTKASEFNKKPSSKVINWPPKRKRRKPLWRQPNGPRRPAKSGFLRGAMKAFGFRVGTALSYSPYLPLRVTCIGDFAIIGVPTEPSVRIAERLRAALLPLGFEAGHVSICGNAGGFTGYADTIGSYLVHEYEGASSYWGREFGELHVAELTRLTKTTGWTEPGSTAPGSSEWLSGGLLSGDQGVGGSARFSVNGARGTNARRAGPASGTGTTARLAPPAARSLVESRIKFGKGGVPALQRGWGCWTGRWAPAKHPIKRMGLNEVSYPYLSDEGPIVRFWTRSKAGAEAKPLCVSGVHLTSDTFPVVVAWHAKPKVWRFIAELPPFDGELGYDVLERGQDEGAGPSSPIAWQA